MCNDLFSDRDLTMEMSSIELVLDFFVPRPFLNNQISSIVDSSWWNMQRHSCQILHLTTWVKHKWVVEMDFYENHHFRNCEREFYGGIGMWDSRSQWDTWENLLRELYRGRLIKRWERDGKERLDHCLLQVWKDYKIFEKSRRDEWDPARKQKEALHS